MPILGDNLNLELYTDYEFIFIAIITPLIATLFFYLILKIYRFITGKSTSIKSIDMRKNENRGLQNLSLRYLVPVFIVIILSYQVSLLFFGGLIVLSSLNGKAIAVVMGILVLLFISGLTLIYKMYSIKS